MKAILQLATSSGPLRELEITLTHGAPLHEVPASVARSMSGLLGEPVCCTGFRVVGYAPRVVR